MMGYGIDIEALYKRWVSEKNESKCEEIKNILIGVIYAEVFGVVELDLPPEYKANMVVVEDSLSLSVSDTLLGMYVSGPLFDGDVPSKEQRDTLLKKGYCNKVIVVGHYGYNACNYAGARLLECITTFSPGVRKIKNRKVKLHL